MSSFFCSKNCERPANTAINDRSCCQQCSNTKGKTVNHTTQCDKLYNEYLLAQFAQNSRNIITEKWACSVCTFRNDSYRTKCQICDNIKPQNKQLSKKLTNKKDINKSPKRKRANIDNWSLKSNSISEPLNKKQKIFSIENNNKYDTDDQKDDEQYMRNIAESDSDIEILNNTKSKELQIIDVFVDPASVNLLLDIAIDDYKVVDNMDMASSDDIDIEYSKQVSNRLDALSQFCCCNGDITHNLNINVETHSLKSKREPLLFNSSSQMKQQRLKIAREKVIKKRIQRLKSIDKKSPNFDLNEFITVDFIMNKIKENESLHNGNIVCDICQHKMYVLSE
eukprot:273177_1